MVYDKQNKLLEDVQQALERAAEFVEEDDFKLGIMRKNQEVELCCKSLESRFAHFKKNRLIQDRAVWGAKGNL